MTLHIPRLLAAATPGPQYYQNYYVGECCDLIFGVSLVDYATTKGLADGEIPKIVRLCIREIEDRGLDAEGIYRVSNLQPRLLQNDVISLIGFWTTCSCARGTTFGDYYLTRFKTGPQLQHKIERNEAEFQFNPRHDDVYAVSSLLKVGDKRIFFFVLR